MKNKRSSTVSNLSNKKKLRQDEIKSNLQEDELMHQMIEALSERIDEFNDLIFETKEEISHCKNDSPDSTSINSRDISNQAPTPNDQLDCCSDNLEEDPDRLQVPPYIAIGDSIGAGGASSIQTSSQVAHHTSFDYNPQSDQNYRYGFTNNEFLAFIAGLDPIEYIIVITIVSILIGVNLTATEAQVLSSTFVFLGVSLGNQVQQELFQSARQNEIRNQQRNAALQTDLDTLYTSIDRLQNEINQLRNQLQT